MTKIKFTLACGLTALLLGACASSPNNESEQPGSIQLAENTTSDKNEIVCRAERRVGSNIAHKVCITKGEQEARREKSGKWLRDTDAFYEQQNTMIRSGAQSGSGN